jgi:Flp pilus assembly protein TadG
MLIQINRRLSPARKPASRGQAMVEFALLSGLLFLLLMGIFDFGRAVAVYINIAEAAHEGARQLVLRSNYTSAPPDTVIINATLAKIGGGGMVLTEDPCLAAHTCPTPDMATTPSTPNSGYIWLTPNRRTGNPTVTVKITFRYAPMTAIISSFTGASLVMTASSSMRAEY